MLFWSGSLEGRKDKWKDVGPQVSSDTLAIPATGLDSSFAAIQALKFIKPKGRWDRDVRWKQGQTWTNPSSYTQRDAGSHRGLPSEDATCLLRTSCSAKEPATYLSVSILPKKNE